MDYYPSLCLSTLHTSTQSNTALHIPALPELHSHHVLASLRILATPCYSLGQAWIMPMYLSAVELMPFLWDAILDSTRQLRAIRELTGTPILPPKTLSVVSSSLAFLCWGIAWLKILLFLLFSREIYSLRNDETKWLSCILAKSFQASVYFSIE